MKSRILHAIALATLVFSLAGCSALSRPLGSLIKTPSNLLKAAGRSVNNLTS